MVDVTKITDMATNLFEKRGSLLSLWQEQALHFYPERADFNTKRTLGEDFASNLTTSFPVVARRDLGDMFSSMLRPSDIKWFRPTTSNFDKLSHDSKIFLEKCGKIQWNAMYDKDAKFMRATKEGDQDYATFGQCVISTEFNKRYNHLYYRCWHLRDVAWVDNERGDPLPIFRRWTTSPAELVATFGDKVSPSVKKKYDNHKQRYDDILVYHAVLPEDYSDKKIVTPYLSLFFEAETKHILAEYPVWTPIYTIPRWETVSGSQYAFSPATVAALADARLMQQMTLVLLEAGEKAVNPPLIGTQDAVRSDMQQFAGGVTWVDAEYDERLGEALRPMTINSNGIPHGMNMVEDVKRAIMSAFYLDKIGLPQLGGDMTAFETSQRVKEYMRKIVPLFDPIQADYNGALCEQTFTILLRNGAFGLVNEIPEELQGKNVKFSFLSPLTENLDRQKVQAFQEAKQMLAETAGLAPTLINTVDIEQAFRESVEAVGVPIHWINSREEVEAKNEAVEQQQQQQQMLAMMQQGGDAAKSMGQAAHQFSQSMMV